jgi:Tol biopolymer transport system component
LTDGVSSGIVAFVANRLHMGVTRMRRWKVGLLAVGVLLVVGASAAASGRPVRENGRIVFVRARCSQSLCKWRIVTATARDRDERLLATFPDGVFDDHFIVNPSPDGRRLAFMASQKIWVMNSDGTGRHVVFTPPNDGTGVDDGPSFTRDGQHLVFTRCCPEGFGYSLWMISVRGTGLHNVTKEPVVNGDGPADTTPQVSPDGRRVAFNRCFPDQGCVVAVANLTTGRFRELTDPTLDSGQPNWSPDGKRIVFEYHSQNGTPNIAIIRTTGTDLRFLTHQNSGASFDPAYSPNGRWVIFSHFPGTRETLDLYRMHPDGTHRRAVTRTPRAHELEPKWMPARAG